MQLSLDLNHNLRSLRRNKGIVALCMLMIGLGMAMSIVMYSLISGAVYNSLPFPDGDSFAVVKRVDINTGGEASGSIDGNTIIDGHTYQYLHSSVETFKDFGAWQNISVTLSDEAVAEQFSAGYVTPNLFQMTPVEPVLGRILLPSDDLPGADPVVLLTYDVWQNYYAGKEDIVGSLSRVNGDLYNVVGVMPDGFTYPVSNQLWLPLQMPENIQPGDSYRVTAMGRLADNASLETASVETNALLTRLAASEPELYGNQGASVVTFTRLYSPSMVFYHVLTALTLSLLLLVCLNVANLLAVRTHERMQELAIRNAMGATPWLLAKSVLLDSLLICLLGSLLGVYLADLGMKFFTSMIAGLYAGLGGAAPQPFWGKEDWHTGTAVAAVLVVLLIWLFSAGLAAWKVSRQDISKMLASGSTGSIGSGNKLGSVMLVSFEIVASCFLLILCGVLLGGAQDLQNKDFGTATEGYLTGRVSLPLANYADSNAQNRYRQELRQLLLAEEGINEVSFTTALPSHQGIRQVYDLEDRSLNGENGYPQQDVVAVAENYFATMEVPLIAGRSFDSSDSLDSLPVVIIDELFAAQMWPAQSALGKRILLNPEQENAQWLSVVGVTSHITQRQPGLGDNQPSLYLPFAQALPSTGGRFSIVLQVDGETESYGRTLQETVAQVDRDIPVSFIQPLTEVLRFSGAFGIFINGISSNIALVTLVLAMTGIYAIIARSVVQRAQEIGIRRALGSSNTAVIWVFLRQAAKYLAFGLIIGGGGAILASNAVSGVIAGFTGVENWLPLVFASVSLGLAGLIFIAAYNPARQLVTLEPGETLRYE